jgi:hypothetical protein
VRVEIRNMVITLAWLKGKVNNILIEPDWLSVYVKRDENSYAIQYEQV